MPVKTGDCGCTSATTDMEILRPAIVVGVNGGAVGESDFLLPVFPEALVALCL